MLTVKPKDDIKWQYTKWQYGFRFNYLFENAPNENYTIILDDEFERQPDTVKQLESMFRSKQSFVNYHMCIVKCKPPALYFLIDKVWRKDTELQILRYWLEDENLIECTPNILEQFFLRCVNEKIIQVKSIDEWIALKVMDKLCGRIN